MNPGLARISVCQFLVGSCGSCGAGTTQPERELLPRRLHRFGVAKNQPTREQSHPLGPIDQSARTPTDSPVARPVKS